MSPGSLLLVAVDLEQDQESFLPWVARIARLLAARVELYYAAPEREDVSDLASALESRAQALRALLGEGAPVEATLERLWDPSRAIVARAKARAADLLVMSPQLRSYWQRLAEGSVVGDVLDEAPCPLLTVPRDLAPPEHGTFTHLLVATDLASHEPLARALALAQLSHAHISCLYTMDTPHAHLAQLSHAEGAESLFQVHLREARHHARAWVKEELGLPHKPSVEVRVGDPAEEILGALDRGGFDLVVMGHGHARSFLKRLLAGSVAEDVVARSPVPVLVVPLTAP